MQVRLRPSRVDDIAFITGLERHPDNRDYIGQWTDAEHLQAIAAESGREHWIIERDGARAGYLIAYDCRAAGAGFYVKRLLVADKERGLGSAALRQFNARVFGLENVTCVWLNVRDWNARAQKVYRNLGFERFDPSPREAALYDAIAEPPGPETFRMRLVRAATKA